MSLFKVYISTTPLYLRDYRSAVLNFFRKFRDKFEIINIEELSIEQNISVERSHSGKQLWLYSSL